MAKNKQSIIAAPTSPLSNPCPSLVHIIHHQLTSCIILLLTYLVDISVQFSRSVMWPMDCTSPSFSLHGISQARILEWIAISFSRGSSPPRDWTHISCIGRQILYHWATWKAYSYKQEGVIRSHWEGKGGGSSCAYLVTEQRSKLERTRNSKVLSWVGSCPVQEVRVRLVWCKGE